MKSGGCDLGKNKAVIRRSDIGAFNLTQGSPVAYKRFFYLWHRNKSNKKKKKSLRAYVRPANRLVELSRELLSALRITETINYLLRTGVHREFFTFEGNVPP